MKRAFACVLLALLAGMAHPAYSLVLESANLSPADGKQALLLDRFFLETSNGWELIPLPQDLMPKNGKPIQTQVTTPTGRKVNVSITPQGPDFLVRLASSDTNIIKWGLGIDAAPREYFTGIMERVVDGPQQASWASHRREGLNLRGQKIEMILKPTTSVYAPFYLSSRGYAVSVGGTWPGFFDFCADETNRVRIEFEGPSFDLKIYTAKTPSELIARHALDAGPPVLPPKWIYTPWRWRDEIKQRTNYYDGTPVTGPFNAELMEDILMMKGYGIPCGVYWIDRPWGPGSQGYDDFKIDSKRLPHFRQNVKWLNDQNIQMALWIGPFYQGHMETNALAWGFNLPGQKKAKSNYPTADFTNPEATGYWQDGVAKLLQLGVAGFKMDRSEEDMPDDGPYKAFDGRTIREVRNAYPPMYVKAAYDIAKKYRVDDFFVMPRAAYTGSASYGVFWGGDIGGTQWGLRASIIAVQRSSVMGYPNWGSDTCGYTKATMEHEVCARWLAFSCFTPIMEVGPTKNVGLWNLKRAPTFWHNNREPIYDTNLIAIWRLYARLHTRLADYSYEQAKLAAKTGTPIVRPLFMADPSSPAAWADWQTFLYGPDILVSAIWKNGQRNQSLYLPAGNQWRDAWTGKIYDGGQKIQIQAELHQMPIFTRVGSSLDLGDLNREYEESVSIASKRPDLKALEAEVNGWFVRNGKKISGAPISQDRNTTIGLLTLRSGKSSGK